MTLEPLPSEMRHFVLEHFNRVGSGFCWEEKAIKLAEVVWTLKPKWSVEIGVFGGKSFIPIGAAVAHIDRGLGQHRALGIDVWQANIAADCYQNTPHENYWNNQNMLDIVREQAFEHVRNLKTLSVQLYVGSSEEASTCFKEEEVGLCHLDGNHSEQYVMKDIECWWPKIQKNGIIILDDIGWIPDKAVDWVQSRSELVWKDEGRGGCTAFYAKK